MDFDVTERKADKGLFTVLRHAGRPVAQFFVPWVPQMAQEFSFFWCGRAKRSDVHDVLARLFQPESEVSMRLVGEASVLNFGYAPAGAPSSELAAANIDIAHRLIEVAALPCSVGLTISTPTPFWPSQVYVWGSVADSEGKGLPEVGIKTTLPDWLKSPFREAILPLFQRTIQVEGEDALWARAVEVAAGLMQ